MTPDILKIAPDGNLTRYLQRIREFPMLSAEEELELARRWRDRQDIEAGHKLVTSHLRLVAKIAMGYRGYGLPVGELISEGNVGMMQAVRRYDLERGFRLATYAMWWIRAAIQEYILHSWSLVKIGTTAAQKKLFFNLRRLKGEMHAIEAGDLHPDEVSQIASRLKVPERDVVAMNQRLAAADQSLNAPVTADNRVEPQEALVDTNENQETSFVTREESAIRKAMLSDALTKLGERQRQILIERWLKDEPTTLAELSRQYGISGERVRQIEVDAIAKLRKAIARPGGQKHSFSEAVDDHPVAAMLPIASPLMHTRMRAVA